MLLHGLSKHVVLTVSAILTAAGLFCIPLILRYHVYKPFRIGLTSSDIVELSEHTSHVWCKGQTLTTLNGTKFTAYALPDTPTFDTKLKRFSFRTGSSLPLGQTDIWALRLLQGSSLNISLCSSMPTAYVTLVRGRHMLDQCLREYKEELEESGESLEANGLDSPESLEDSHDSTVSSSEGVFGNGTEVEEFECDLAIGQLTGSGCNVNNASTNQNAQGFKVNNESTNQHALSFKVNVSDVYYVVFSTASILLDLVPNRLSAILDLERVVYEVKDSQSNCTAVEECYFRFGLDSELYVIAEMGPPDGHVLTHDMLVSTCEPRQGLYFAFYLALFLLIFVAAFQ